MSAPVFKIIPTGVKYNVSPISLSGTLQGTSSVTPIFSHYLASGVAETVSILEAGTYSFEVIRDSRWNNDGSYLTVIGSITYLDGTKKELVGRLNTYMGGVIFSNGNFDFFPNDFLTNSFDSFLSVGQFAPNNNADVGKKFSFTIAQASPTYSITASSTSVNEGSSVSFQIKTNSVEWGSSLNYSISGISLADLNGGTLNGSTTIVQDGDGGVATVTVNIAADQKLEGSETLTLSLAGSTAMVTIYDTSLPHVNFLNAVPSGSVLINGTIKKGSTVTASNTISDLDGLGAITYKWQSSSNLIQWADVKTGASLTIADTQVGKYLRVNASYVDGHGTNETVISDVSDLLRSGNHKPVVRPISKAVSIFENTSFNFALPAGTFTEVDVGDKITYSSSNLLVGLNINPISGTIYGKVGFTTADNPQQIITIKATDRSGAFATTQLTLNIVNVPALLGKTSIDTLIAGNDNDRIWGKGGLDTLTGGSGTDEFNFDVSPLLGLATITDFVTGEDKLRLSLKVFPTLGVIPSNATETQLNANLFETGSWLTTATKTATRIFFNQSTSTLYYDADGVGGVSPTPIVKLLGVTTSLHSCDIFIFN